MNLTPSTYIIIPARLSIQNIQEPLNLAQQILRAAPFHAPELNHLNLYLLVRKNMLIQTELLKSYCTITT